MGEKVKLFTSFTNVNESGTQQCCSKAKDLKVEAKAKDFKNFSRSRPRTHKPRPRPRTCKSRPRTWIKDNWHFSDFSMNLKMWVIWS